MSKFSIEACGEVVIAEFCDNLSPNVCQELRKLLPYTAKTTFAKIAGDEVFFVVPWTFGHDGGGLPVMDTCKAGSITYWPKRPHLCFFHDAPQPEDQLCTVVGQIIENLDGMGKINEAIRAKNGIEMTLRLIED